MGNLMKKLIQNTKLRQVTLSSKNTLKSLFWLKEESLILEFGCLSINSQKFTLLKKAIFEQQGRTLLSTKVALKNVIYILRTTPYKNINQITVFMKMEINCHLTIYKFISILKGFPNLLKARLQTKSRN